MDLFQIALALSTLLCSLVAGFLFAFVIVAMPGIGALNDHDFLQAFKVMDRVIQNNQPIFILVWAGSVILLAITAVLSIWHLEGVNRLLIIGAAAIYFFAVQLPTVIVNVPLNNQLQAQSLSSMNESELQVARKQFEPRWVRWNAIRTIFAIVTSTLLIILLIRL
ncbi:MAG: DUF1772 domain-containing protein [Calditrichia bacterium]